MSKPSQKEAERWQFDRFRRLSGLLADRGMVEDEEPDFLVSDGRVVGVELTELFWEDGAGVVPHQAMEALRARIAEVAWGKYDAKGLPPVHVSAHFNPSYIPSKRDVPRLADAIANWAAAHVPEEGSSFSEDYDWDNREYFPDEVNHLGIWRSAGFEKSFFSSPGAAFIPELARSDIERALRLKEPKVQTYRKKCEEAWLLINCDGGRLSNVFELEDAVLEEDFESSFDRVFLFRHMAGKIHEIRIRRAEA
jgi:hypothetical protein